MYCRVGNFIEMLYVFGSNECLNNLFCVFDSGLSCDPGHSDTR